MRIDIWSDVVCPWCSIGKRRLERALADFPHRDDVEVVYHSFLLDPGAPTEPTGTAQEMLSRKYGNRMLPQVTPRTLSISACGTLRIWKIPACAASTRNAVLSCTFAVTVAVSTPDSSRACGGNEALASDARMSIELPMDVTMFQSLSQARTVISKGMPATCALGVPVRPVAVPGAGLSPGNNT